MATATKPVEVRYIEPGLRLVILKRKRRAYNSRHSLKVEMARVDRKEGDVWIEGEVECCWWIYDAADDVVAEGEGYGSDYESAVLAGDDSLRSFR